MDSKPEYNSPTGPREDSCSDNPDVTQQGDSSRSSVLQSANSQGDSSPGDSLPGNSLDGDDLQRFRGLAEQTLKQVDQGYVHDELSRILTWILYGAIPLAGLIWFDWAAREWLLFLLIGAWTGIICDSFRLCFLYLQIMKTAERSYRNTMVWAKVEELRKGQNIVIRKRLKSDYKPVGGVFVDFVFGTIGTAMIIGLFPGGLFDGVFSRNAGQPGVAEFSTLLWSIAGFVGYRVLFTIRDILVARRTRNAESGDQESTVRVAVGLRGAGLFVLGFLVAFISGEDGGYEISSDSAAWWVMVIVNSLTVVVGLMLIGAVLSTLSDARWLRAYLSRTPSCEQD